MRGRQRRRGVEALPHPAHEGRAAAAAHRHVGAEREGQRVQGLRVEPNTPKPPEQLERRRRVGRAAADSGPERQVLHEGQMCGRRDAGRRGERACRAEDDIVPFRRQRAAEGPRDPQLEPVRWAGHQDVVDAGEGHQAVEQMIAVTPPAGDVEIEVELGRRRGASLAHPRAYWSP